MQNKDIKIIKEYAQKVVKKEIKYDFDMELEIIDIKNAIEALKKENLKLFEEIEKYKIDKIKADINSEFRTQQKINYSFKKNNKSKGEK